MRDRSAFLRIREGAFTYFLAADARVSIERRSSGAFEASDDGASVRVAWYLSGSGRLPVIRLGGLLQTEVQDWEHAVLLSGETELLGVAAEQIHALPEAEKPMVQPFNLVGGRLPGGSVITGVCPGTDPEYLVLDMVRLRHCILGSMRA